MQCCNKCNKRFTETTFRSALRDNFFVFYELVCLGNCTVGRFFVVVVVINFASATPHPSGVTAAAEFHGPEGVDYCVRYALMHIRPTTKQNFSPPRSYQEKLDTISHAQGFASHGDNIQKCAQGQLCFL